MTVDVEASELWTEDGQVIQRTVRCQEISVIIRTSAAKGANDFAAVVHSARHSVEVAQDGQDVVWWHHRLGDGGQLVVEIVLNSGCLSLIYLV